METVIRPRIVNGEESNSNRSWGPAPSDPNGPWEELPSRESSSREQDGSGSPITHEELVERALRAIPPTTNDGWIRDLPSQVIKPDEVSK